MAGRVAVRSRGVLAGRELAREQVVEIQRARLLAAAVATAEELGYTRVTVAHITRRARVSRRTFYELFADREECMLAVVEETLGAIAGELAAAGLEGLGWRERVRGGLSVILGFFDREPALARVCVVQAARGGPAVIERREWALGRLAEAIDAGRREGPRGRECSPLTAEGLVGAIQAIIYARLLRRERKPLSGLLGELMGMIVLPYLGPAVARREQSLPASTVARGKRRDVAGYAQGALDPLAGLSMRMTYRTARVLQGVAEHPGASNRMLAGYAEISDQGQVSKLLARLERLGLLANHGPGHVKGEPNAWALTPMGEQVARSIGVHARGERRAA